MPIELPKDTQSRLQQSIKRYFAEHLEQDIGDLKASLVLDFCLREIGPCIYNKAILDAQSHMQDRVTDLDSSLWQPEEVYWER